MPIFHVKSDRQSQFSEMFDGRAGDGFVLATIDEVEQLQLLGPGKLSPLARSRFGDYIAFPIRAASMGYWPAGKPESEIYAALHAGLSPDEMLVPLCVA